MARDRNGCGREGDEEERGEKEEPPRRERRQKVKKRKEESSSESSGESDGEKDRGKKRKRKRRTSTDSDSDSRSESESESEEDLRRRKRRERRRKEKEREEEKERRRRRKEKERERRKRKERESEKDKKKEKKKKKKEKDDKGSKGAVTNSWGKFGVIKETDMWNKRPEFTAWLSEVKQVNLETLPNWEEKQMFKQFMEDHNTATFPSKKYYNLDAYHQHKIYKEQKNGIKKVHVTERTNFNDEEQRRQELLLEREKQKEEKVEELKRSMQSGMAQAMKEQARLREEMAYQYKLGNFEAAAAIQRRLDPDVAM